jgi:hypothetical protein
MLCDWVSRISDKAQQAGAISEPIFNVQKTTGHIVLPWFVTPRKHGYRSFPLFQLIHVS